MRKHKNNKTSLVRERILWLGVFALAATVFLFVVVSSPLSFTNMDDGADNTVTIVKAVVSGSSTVSKTASSGRLDLNTVSFDDLTGVPGIGEILARRIIQYRESHGGFDNLQELNQVEGIGDARFESVKTYFTVK